MMGLFYVWAVFTFGLICYSLGHADAWTKWENWTKGQLSDETKAKINGK